MSGGAKRVDGRVWRKEEMRGFGVHGNLSINHRAADRPKDWGLGIVREREDDYLPPRARWVALVRFGDMYI